MAKVIDINIKKSGYVKILHKSGWEKGFQLRGEWDGEYESMGLLPNSNITSYCKGLYHSGIKKGKWENFYIPHDRKDSITVMTGRYINGKQHGEWIVHKCGLSIKKCIYKEGKIIDSE
jgi:hypothetical protein|tara:strand:- start:198 stop:551 length:354 start_codon:yes stop_codon:yes gene_type:complete